MDYWIGLLDWIITVAADRYNGLRREQRVEASGASSDEEHQVLSVLQGTLSGPDLHDPSQTDRHLLQLHSDRSVCSPILPHARVLLATT